MSTATPLLLVSTATLWYAAARLPRFFAKAGFEVALLTPRNSLAEKSGFIAKIGYLPDNATVPQWITAFAGAVAAAAPRLVVPCDDMAFRLLRTLAVSPPPEMNLTMALQLGALIRDSLGDPAYYDATIDKTLLPQFARQHGVRVPEFVVAGTLAEAEEFAAQIGWPVVLKRGYGAAGDGVAICAERDALAAAWTSLATVDALRLEGANKAQLICQAHIPGHVWPQYAAAWDGKLVAGFARDKLVTNPAPTGPSTVTRSLHMPECHAFATTLVEAFGMKGLFGFEFIVHQQTGHAYLIEVNRRITPGMHIGAWFGVDLCAALHSAVTGAPMPTRARLDDGEEHRFAHFPQEWLRDPDSAYLRDLPVDAPWDEPELLEALLALRHNA